MRDFSLIIYKRLLDSLRSNGYHFQTFEEYLSKPLAKTVILRHDIDARKLHALTFAKIQNEKGIKGSYYFRVIPSVYDKNIIRQISDLGHEIGYHYEDMDFANGDPDKAIMLFKKHLADLRTVAPVKTICMHGSPMSKYDNRSVWNSYAYQDFGLVGEPYFDLDFNKIFYITDTGRKWDGDAVSVRDKVESDYNMKFRSTSDIIDAIKTNKFPHQVMFTFHPQRWTDKKSLWIKEKYIQKLKNTAKYILIRWRSRA